MIFTSIHITSYTQRVNYTLFYSSSGFFLRITNPSMMGVSEVYSSVANSALSPAMWLVRFDWKN